MEREQLAKQLLTVKEGLKTLLDGKSLEIEQLVRRLTQVKAAAKRAKPDAVFARDFAHRITKLTNEIPAMT